MNRMSVFLSGMLIVLPSYALANENSPEMIVVASLGMLAVAAIAIVSAMKAEQSARNPSDTQFADVDNIASKLEQRLDKSGIYKLSVLRQSGNVERTIENISSENVIQQVLQTIKRAKIGTVSIYGNDESLSVYRTTHNGRGSQEGKRVGGFEIHLTARSSLLPHATSQMDGGFSFENEGLLVETDERCIRISADNEAQKSIVKAFFRVYQQFEDYPSAFVERYDSDTGEGADGFHYNAVILFLFIAGSYLRTETELTDELRADFCGSETAWQREIGADPRITKVIGAMAFGSSDLKSIHTEFVLWWSKCEKMGHLHNDKLKIDLLRPRFLDMKF